MHAVVISLEWLRSVSRTIPTRIPRKQLGRNQPVAGTDKLSAHTLIVCSSLTMGFKKLKKLFSNVF